MCLHHCIYRSRVSKSCIWFYTVYHSCMCIYNVCIYDQWIQILSGDTVVIRGQPRGGPPPTRTLTLSKITAPRLARRANPNVEGSLDTVDEVSLYVFLII